LVLHQAHALMDAPSFPDVIGERRHDAVAVAAK
jgi:hypothetical protein